MPIEIRLNGEARTVPDALNLAELLKHLDVPLERVAVERNRRIVPRSEWPQVAVSRGDELEIVHFVGGGAPDSDALTIAGRAFKSRLIVGTGKYPSHQVMREA